MRKMEVEEETYLDSHNLLLVELEFELQICTIVRHILFTIPAQFVSLLIFQSAKLE